MGSRRASREGPRSRTPSRGRHRRRRSIATERIRCVLCRGTRIRAEAKLAVG